MSNPKFKAVFYPSQNSTNKAHQPVSGSYDVYIPGDSFEKRMLDKAGIKLLLKQLGVTMQGQGSFRYTPSKDTVFRSRNIADINTAAETGIGWHTERYRVRKKDGALINKGVPSVTVGNKGYIFPTFETIEKNKNDKLFPVVIFRITDTAQKP